MDSTINTDSAQIVITETKNVENLYQRLAEARKEIKSSKKPGEEKRSDKLRIWGIRTIIFSLILMATGFVALFAGKWLTESSSNYVSMPTRYFFGVLLFLFLIGFLTLFVGLLAEFGFLIKRNENQRARETYTETTGYSEQGEIIAKDYRIGTLERTEKGVLQILTSLNERGGAIDTFIKHLPSAIGWIVLLLVVNSLFDARQLQTILSAETVKNFSSLQEQMTNQIFSGIVSRLHPLAIFDLLMYALVINVAAKIHPVLMSVAAARRVGRYRDYLAILEQAKEFRKEFEIERTANTESPEYRVSSAEDSNKYTASDGGRTN